MLYDLSNKLSLAQFNKRVLALVEKGRLVELTDKSSRSNQQNRYLHLLLGVLALETGNTLEYVKLHYYKKAANAAIYVEHYEDEMTGSVEVVRSSRSLSTEEMATSIDRFKIWASEHGIYLPDADDQQMLDAIEYEMNKQRRYL